MSSCLRPATLVDRSLLVELMTEFYAESQYALDARRADEVFRRLLIEPTLGRVWLLESEALVAGYVVLTLGYSMEYGGRDAFIDDLFIRPAFRGKGLGRSALAEVRSAALSLGVRALHLEVGRDNSAAQALYRRAGFEDSGRQLLTLRLADPTHE
jgi:ribosomal protein S18 acetylase RimI-like enzyme